ncbi:50S ribosomal protein L32e [Candidatus Pacearchaeota archaeon]|nr:50S ribosomal protein L32e [Candidatus Pacearchaeota archaeon]
MAKKFLRRWWNKKSRLGKGRKNKQKWRRPKGRHNKMRENRKGYAKVVNIGYRKKTKERVDITKTAHIKNIKELLKLKKGDKAIIGKIGKKKKIEIAKKAAELNIKIINLNVQKFLKRAEKSGKKDEKGEKKRPGK